MIDRDVSNLIAMLRYRRPHGSYSEAQFIERFLNPLGVRSDGFGNLILRIGTAPVLWSSHTDTVHRMTGEQKVVYHPDAGLIMLPKGSKSNCLGADCGAGVWLMSEMIKAGVEGLYVFHRGEECGGLGSRWIAKNTPELLDGIQYAVAFDRYGKSSVITHQGSRCASDAFAYALGDALGLGMLPDSGGIYTDTAEYTHLVPECTNVSVGYAGHHSPAEGLDVAFIKRLRDALLTLDVHTLPVRRDPALDNEYPCKWDFREKDYAYGGRRYYDLTGDDDTFDPNLGDMVELVSEYPDIVADILAAYGVGLHELQEEIHAQTGRLHHA